MSYKQIFAGETKWEYRDKMLVLHNELAVYNKKWGLERGTNIHETGARHRSTEEYKRELSEECTTLEKKIEKYREILSEVNQDIYRARIKQKGLTTMIRNMEKSKEKLSNKKNELEEAITKGNGDTSKLIVELEKLNKDISKLNEKIEGKKSKLQTAVDELTSLQEQINELKNKKKNSEKREIKLLIIFSYKYNIGFLMPYFQTYFKNSNLNFIFLISKQWTSLKTHCLKIFQNEANKSCNVHYFSSPDT